MNSPIIYNSQLYNQSYTDRKGCSYHCFLWRWGAQKQKDSDGWEFENLRELLKLLGLDLNCGLHDASMLAKQIPV